MSDPKSVLTSHLRRDLIDRFRQNKSEAPVHSAEIRVDEAHYHFEQFSEYQKLLIPQVVARRLGVENPFFKVHQVNAGAVTHIDGRELINFSSYNYLGLCADKRVNAAAIEAIDRYGTSASASRLVAGERPIHQELEASLAAQYDVEDCVVFVSGHATNVTSLGCLFGPKDLILHDALIHSSMLEGIRLSGAARRSFPHNDYEALKTILSEIRTRFERVLIVIEGVYSMDGDVPDLPQFIAIRNRYKSFLMVDEAHSLGVLGNRGGGIREHYGIAGNEVDIWMGTLSKALAGCGGYIAGSKALVELLKFSASGFVYSVGMSPPLAAASLAALRIMHSEPERVAQLRANATLFLTLAKQRGIDTGLSHGVAVVPVIIGSSLKAAKLAQKMFEKGINVQPIIHPAVEERAARLRFFISCQHNEAQLKQTVETLSQLV